MACAGLQRDRHRHCPLFVRGMATLDDANRSCFALLRSSTFTWARLAPSSVTRPGSCSSAPAPLARSPSADRYAAATFWSTASARTAGPTPTRPTSSRVAPTRLSSARRAMANTSRGPCSSIWTPRRSTRSAPALTARCSTPSKCSAARRMRPTTTLAATTPSARSRLITAWIGSDALLVRIFRLDTSR